MRFTLIILSAFVVLGCSERNVQNNSVASNRGSMVYLYPEDTIFIGDSTVVKERLFVDLSYFHNFKVTFYEHSRNRETIRHYWTILIYDKKMNLLDSIVQSAYVFSADFVNFEGSRSYITGVNKNMEVIDNNYGSFIVADFNFDKKNDFAGAGRARERVDC